MLDSALNIIKEVVAGEVDKNANISDDKKGLAIKTITSAIGQGFSDNASDLGSLLSGTGGGGSILSGIQDTVVDSLAKKIGLDPKIASGLISAILPTVIKALSTGKNGLDLGSIAGAFTDDDKKGGLGGLLGSIGKLFS